jgi:quinolinate synthase
MSLRRRTPPREGLLELVRRALEEDIGTGDVTTEATVPVAARARATLTQKAPGVIYGLDAAEAAFTLLDPTARRERLVEEGVWREGGGRVLVVEGRARALLSAERTALNFLARLSGVATLAARAAREAAGTGATVIDTRKTTPGLRALEKAAVACGGAAAGGGVRNHRAGLYDAVLIKENHIAAAGGIAPAVARAREAAPELAATLEVEVRDTEEIEQALAAGAPRLLLDNMDDAQLRAGRRPRAARGQRRRHPPDAPGARADRGRLDLDGRPHALCARAGPLPHPGGSAMTLSLPLAPSQAPSTPQLPPEEIAALQAEVRALASERHAVILAHNYQVPEVQDVADYVGDSLGLSRQAAAAGGETIVFCGVHFMAETASILCPEKTVLIPDLDAGCSLAASIDAAQLRAWKEQYPSGVVVMYVNTTAEVKALTDYCCTSANAEQVVRHIYETHGPDTEILFGPDMWLGSYVEKRTSKRMHVWDGECHVHAGIRPADIEATRAAHPGADFLIHPECGCSTSVMEYVAAGDIAAEGVHMLSTGGMLRYAEEAERRAEGGRAEGGPGEAGEHAGIGEGEPEHQVSEVGLPPGADDAPRAAREVVVATEVGMLHPLRMAAPDIEFIPANAEASCKYMKMITLPKLRDALRDGKYEVRVPAGIAERARVPIDRMVAIG